MPCDSYCREAFNVILPDAEQAETWYVCLLQEVPFYGGPQEGGWWGSDIFCIAARECFNRKQAEQYAKQVQKVADELSTEARTRHGDHCLLTLDWLEERGLESDFLSEPDGEESYTVIVSKGIPEPSYGSRRYE